MHDAPRYDPLEASDFFADGSAVRPLMAGTVARGHLNADTFLHTGKDAAGLPVAEFPFAISRADLDRGEQRFNVYCAPCHGQTGEGNGMVVQRGYRQAQSMHIDRLRTAPVGYFYDVITNGFGAMQGYAEQIPVRDRWLIVAYVRALQLSQHASVNDVPADKRPELDASAPETPSASTAKPAAAAPAAEKH
jgi:mono/diheme cytochrome c family protein